MEDEADVWAGSLDSRYIDLTAWRSVVRSESFVWNARRTRISSKGYVNKTDVTPNMSAGPSSFSRISYRKRHLQRKICLASAYRAWVSGPRRSVPPETHSWKTYRFCPIICHEFDSSVWEDSQQCCRMTLEKPSESVCPVYTTSSMHETHGRSCLSVDLSPRGSLNVPAYFENSGLDVWNKIFTLSRGAIAVLACRVSSKHIHVKNDIPHIQLYLRQLHYSRLTSSATDRHTRGSSP